MEENDGHPSRRLTMDLIRSCNYPKTSDKSTDDVVEGLLRLTVIRLDWQRISSIESLDVYSHVRELYLQHNRIEVIEELDALVNLQLLALGSNRISRVENLRHLRELRVLDLSNNLIQDFDGSELPRAVLILNMEGNPCSTRKSYRSHLAATLPKLIDLDGQEVERRPPRWDGDGEDKNEGVEESKNTYPDYTENKDENDLSTLYVSVEGPGDSRVVPLSFSLESNLKQVARRFCAENGLDDENDEDDLVQEMYSALPLGPNSSSKTPIPRQCSEEKGEKSLLDRKQEALWELEEAHIRAMEKSFALFEEEKKNLLDKTRRLVENKTKEAHDRSAAMDKEISKVLSDARGSLHAQRKHYSKENHDFADKMRSYAENFIAARRKAREEEMERGKPVPINGDAHTED